jgi:GntR family transcriptional regulator/MocR family aminotransferase
VVDAALASEGAAQTPMFLRIARAIADAARSGRVSKGERLPSSRALAERLSVHRNTVLAAYRELASEGFLRGDQGRGTFLADALPQVPGKRMREAHRSGAKTTRSATPNFAFDPPRAIHVTGSAPKGAFALYGGVPDTRILPCDAFARAVRRVLRKPSDVLGYGDARGEPRLRAAIAEMLRNTRGLAVQADDVLITRGSQMALALLGRVLVRPGDVVAVEALGYKPAARALAQPGARLVAVPVDEQGLDVAALERVCRRTRLRAVYLTPHHHYPTTVTLSAARRMALYELALRERFAIIEDDYDHEFHYDGKPVLPMASADSHGVVVYVGTLSKVFAPALRIGYLIAPARVQEAALAARFDMDRQGDRVMERALAELIEEGDLQRHLWRARRVYQARRDHALEAVEASLSPWLEVQRPAGGLALWARVSKDLPVARWDELARERGVYLQPGKLFDFDERELPNVRIGFGAVNEAEMTRAMALLRAAAQQATRKTRARKRA